MNVLLAFDKFKGAMSAGEACRVAAEGIRRVRPEWTLFEAPLTDGGEGFCPILTEACGGALAWHTVADPLMRPVKAPIGWVEAQALPAAARQLLGCGERERIAVIEMAAASGLPLLAGEERDPWKTSSRGTGELILRAAQEGADRILLGVGGSATNDCGAGILEALGVEFLGAGGDPIPSITPENFGKVDSVLFSKVGPLPPVVIASDVQSPLLGEKGATRVFGPQKGLVDVEAMESVFERMAILLAASSSLELDPALPGMGAAGGVSFGLAACSRISLVPGFSLVSAWMGLPEKFRAADWVLTGEGRLDRGSLSGKGPVELLREAVGYGTRPVAMAGAIEEGVGECLSEELGGCECRTLSKPEWSLERSMRCAAERLREESADWAESLGAEYQP